MKLPVHILTPALAIALLLPGLVAVLPVCAMPDCGPAMVRAEHDCCPAAAATIAAACCKQRLEAPAVPPNLPEPPAAADPATFTVVTATVPVATQAAGFRTASAGPPLPLDSLAQSCILRI